MLLSDTVVVDIVPAIIPTSLDDLKEKLTQVSAFAKEVQIDIVDGIFAKPASWPYLETKDGESLADLLAKFPKTDLQIEFDLMIDTPEKTLDLWAACKPAKIVVHVEGVDDMEDVIRHSAHHDYILGVSASNDTSIDALNVLDTENIGYFQLMGIDKIGGQGQAFDERVLLRIGTLLACCAQHPVSIDGSVNANTLPKLVAAGAHRFVVGSAIWNAEDPKTAFETLQTVSI